jgi:hypothetical protein
MYNYKTFIESNRALDFDYTNDPYETGFTFYQKYGFYTTAEMLGISNPDEWMAELMKRHIPEADDKRNRSMPTITTTPCGGCGSELVEMSIGLGDTIAKITKATGLDKLAEMYTRITGKDCGCKTRQEYFNKLLPYKVQERT